MHLLFEKTFFSYQTHFSIFHHAMKITAETNNNKCRMLGREQFPSILVLCHVKTCCM